MEFNSGRIDYLPCREGKRGPIPTETPLILQRLHVEPQYWLFLATHLKSRFKGLVGSAYPPKAPREALAYRRTPNVAALRE